MTSGNKDHTRRTMTVSETTYWLQWRWIEWTKKICQCTIDRENMALSHCASPGSRSFHCTSAPLSEQKISDRAALDTARTGFADSNYSSLQILLVELLRYRLTVYQWWGWDSHCRSAAGIQRFPSEETPAWSFSPVGFPISSTHTYHWSEVDSQKMVVIKLS